MKKLAILFLLLPLVNAGAFPCVNGDCSGTSSNFDYDLVCDDDGNICVPCLDQQELFIFDCENYSHEEGILICEDELKCEQECGANPVCDQYEPGQSSGSFCCDGTCNPDDSVGSPPCNCSTGHCDEGYCSTGITCHYNISCGLTGWESSSCSDLQDECPSEPNPDKLILKECTANGCETQEIYCNTTTECAEEKTCGGLEYKCYYHEGEYIWMETDNFQDNETACTDSHDNDCNDATDCEDANCEYHENCTDTEPNTCGQYKDCPEIPCKSWTCSGDGATGTCVYHEVQDNTTCENGVCCNGKCCAGTCCAGKCCLNICCNGKCCDENQTCIQGNCSLDCSNQGEPCPCCEGLVCCEGTCRQYCQGDCIPGEKSSCGTQGVCKGVTQECNEQGKWPGCQIPNYETQEISCEDGLDNDCDGLTDCDGPDPSCAGKDSYNACKDGHVYLMDFCGNKKELVQNCSTNKTGFVGDCVEGQCKERYSNNSSPRVIIDMPEENKSYEELHITFRPVDDGTGELMCFYRLDNTGNWTRIGVPEITNEQIVEYSPAKPLSPGKHSVSVKCHDGSSETKSIPTTHFQIQEKQVPTPTKNETHVLIKQDGLPIPIVLSIFFAVIIMLIGFHLYSRRYTKIEARKTGEELIAEKAEESRGEHIEQLKQRKTKLRKTIIELKEKQETMGLTRKEDTMKEAYEEELVRVEDELLETPEFLRELDARAEQALTQAVIGVPSKKIIRELVKEGYTQREIQIIKKFFQDKKTKR